MNSTKVRQIIDIVVAVALLIFAVISAIQGEMAECLLALILLEVGEINKKTGRGV